MAVCGFDKLNLSGFDTPFTKNVQGPPKNGDFVLNLRNMRFSCLK